MAKKFWDSLTRKLNLTGDDKLLIGNGSTEGVNYANLSDFVQFLSSLTGSLIEIRYGVGNNPSVAPALNKTDRDPAGWGVEVPTDITEDEYIWMVIGRLSLEDELIGEWNEPVRLTGVKGTSGNPGKDGEDGTPGGAGSHVEIRYAKNGSFTAPPALNQTQRVPSGWNTIAPSVLPGEYLWETRASINSSSDALEGSWSNPIRSTGLGGGDGLNQATVTLYHRTSSNTAPTSPSNNITYTFATGATSAANNGWSREIPLGDGAYRWMIQAAAIGSGTTDTITPPDWTTPAIFSEDGTDGTSGKDGASIIMRGDWSATAQYVGTPEIVHVVKYNGLGYLTRTDAGIIPIGTEPTNTEYWNEFTEDIDALIVDFLVAYSAYIQNLTVGSLKTATEGSRLEITPASNSLVFWDTHSEYPEVEVGIIPLFIELPDSPPYGQSINVGGIKGSIREFGNYVYGLSQYGLSYSGEGAIVYKGYNWGGGGFTMTTRIKAGIVSKNTIDVQHYYGMATDKLFVEESITVLERHNEPSTPVFATGWTGTHNGMKYVKGIAVGPA